MYDADISLNSQSMSLVSICLVPSVFYFYTQLFCIFWAYNLIYIFNKMQFCYGQLSLIYFHSKLSYHLRHMCKMYFNK